MFFAVFQVVRMTLYASAFSIIVQLLLKYKCFLKNLTSLCITVIIQSYDARELHSSGAIRVSKVHYTQEVIPC